MSSFFKHKNGTSVEINLNSLRFIGKEKDDLPDYKLEIVTKGFFFKIYLLLFCMCKNKIHLFLIANKIIKYST